MKNKFLILLTLLLISCNIPSTPKRRIIFQLPSFEKELVFENGRFYVERVKEIKTETGTENKIIDEKFGIFVEYNGTKYYMEKIKSFSSNYFETKMELVNENIKCTLKVVPDKVDSKFKFFLASNKGYPGVEFNLKSMGYLYGQGEIGCRPLLDKDCTGSSEFILNKTSFKRDPFETTEYNDIITPFWLTSNGFGVYPYRYDPIKVALDNIHNYFSITSKLTGSFSFKIILGNNTYDVYKLWIKERFIYNGSYPVEMLKRIIWTTWAEFKQKIDQNKIIDFYDDITNHGFPIGIMEIDDKWQKEWGDTDFDKNRFPDPVNMVNYLHNNDVLVSLWVPPFIYKDSENFKTADEKGYFVKRKDGSTYMIPWWDTALFIPLSGMIDFTNMEAADWFRTKLQELKDKYGIDGFKFDGGDVMFLPKDAVLDKKIYRNRFTDYYVTWTKTISGYEVRAAYLEQGKGVIVRQFDKTSTWGTNNGLKAVLTQTLALGIIGYPLVLPDMIGGNEYFGKASDLLMKRWCQLNTFLPMMQFSIKPWRKGFSPDVEKVCRDAARLHLSFVNRIVDLADSANKSGDPIVKPLFFVFPDDKISYSIDDEFMFGDKILVAPFVTPDSKRNVYLPAGSWEDQLIYKKYDGPTWITIEDSDIVHYFLRTSDEESY